MARNEVIQKIKAVLAESANLCVFTGAGISCPSGIPDFRSAEGLYNRESGRKTPPEVILSRSFFKSRPAEFFEFYKHSMVYPDAKPNRAHLFFAGLEKKGKHTPVVTQNIDGLHQAAGSADVLELHGSVHRNFCAVCGAFYDLSAVLTAAGVPRCGRDNGIIKPDVVLYEEPLDDGVTGRAVGAVAGADTLFVVGTSLAVSPANTLLRYFRGKNLIIVNK